MYGREDFHQKDTESGGSETLEDVWVPPVGMDRQHAEFLLYLLRTGRLNEGPGQQALPKLSPRPTAMEESTD